MTVTRINELPVVIEQKLINELRDLIEDPNYLGDLYRLDDWRFYDNNVFLNAYLFGSPQRDAPLLGERTLREEIELANNKRRQNSAISLILDENQTTDWMNHGPGSLVNPSAIPIIEAFFLDDGGVQLPPREQAYTLEQVEEFYTQNNQNFTSVQYYSLDTGNFKLTDPDWLGRSNTYGGLEFVVPRRDDFQFNGFEEPLFHVGDNGEKRITNLYLTPSWDDVGYSSDNDVVRTLNERFNIANFDPYAIGREVRIVFTGAGLNVGDYSLSEFEQDFSEYNDIVDGLWVPKLLFGGGGFTKLLRSQNDAARYFEKSRHVIYGTIADDVLDPLNNIVKTHPAEGIDPVGESEGFILVGGSGNDEIRGANQNEIFQFQNIDAIDSSEINFVENFFLTRTSLRQLTPGGKLSDDYIYGGVGNDTLSGGVGADKLYGGEGNDRLIGSSLSDDDGVEDTLKGGLGIDIYLVGNGDKIVENDGLGAVSLQKSDGSFETLAGGVRKKDDPESVWTNEDEGSTYTLTGNTMVVATSEETISIENVQLKDEGNDTYSFLGMMFKEEPKMAPALPGVDSQDTSLEVNWDKRSAWLQEASDSGLSTKETIQKYGRYEDTYGWLNSWQSPYTHTRERTEEFIEVTVMPPGSIFPLSNIEGGPGNSIILGDDNPNRITDNWQVPEFSGFFPQLLSRSEYDGLGGLNPNPGNGDIDILDGGGGDDWLVGSYGNDLLIGGEGDDTLQSGFGLYPYETKEDFQLLRDWVDLSPHQSSRDTLYGGAGNDRLYADADENRLFGEEGDDILVGGADKDELYGGTGSDYLNGDLYFKKYNKYVNGGFVIGADPSNESEKAGDDYLDGGEGDDQATGGGGDDWVYGKEGDDLLIGDDPRIKATVALTALKGEIIMAEMVLKFDVQTAQIV